MTTRYASFSNKTNYLLLAQNWSSLWKNKYQIRDNICPHWYLLKTSSKRVKTNIRVINEPSSVLTFWSFSCGLNKTDYYLKSNMKVGLSWNSIQNKICNEITNKHSFHVSNHTTSCYHFNWLLSISETDSIDFRDWTLSLFHKIVVRFDKTLWPRIDFYLVNH